MIQRVILRKSSVELRKYTENRVRSILIQLGIWLIYVYMSKDINFEKYGFIHMVIFVIIWNILANDLFNLLNYLLDYIKGLRIIYEKNINVGVLILVGIGLGVLVLIGCFTIPTAVEFITKVDFNFINLKENANAILIKPETLVLQAALIQVSVDLLIKFFEIMVVEVGSLEKFLIKFREEAINDLLDSSEDLNNEKISNRKNMVKKVIELVENKPKKVTNEVYDDGKIYSKNKKRTFRQTKRKGKKRQ